MPNPLIAISGTVTGAERVVSRMTSQSPINAVARMRQTVRALGYQLETLVRGTYLNGAALKRKSGRLARSVNTRFVSTPTSETASTGTALSYGTIWELTGSKAYTMYPKNKKALYWPGADHPVRSVFRPAQAPRPFLRPALDKMRPLIRTSLADAVGGAISGEA